jgi:yecA family protein
VHQLTSEQEQQLSHWLVDNAPTQTLCLNAVKGFFFAIIASPDPIDVSDWLPVIFNDQTDNIPNEITMILAQLYNHTSDKVFDDGYTLPSVTEFSDMVEANFLSGHPLHEWSYGFACGVNFYSNQLLDDMPESSEILETFTLGIMAMTFFADREMAQEVIDSQIDSNINVFSPIMYSMIEDMAPNFAQIVEQAALSTGRYEEESGEWGEE